MYSVQRVCASSMACLAGPLPGTGFSFVARLQIANLVVICWLSGRWNVDWGQERGQGCLGARARGSVPGCCCGPIFVAGAAHSDGSHVTTSANCGNNATKVSWETHTKLHALWLKGRGKQNTSSKARERGGEGGVVDGTWVGDSKTPSVTFCCCCPLALGCISFSIFRNTLQRVQSVGYIGYTY